MGHRGAVPASAQWCAAMPGSLVGRMSAALPTQTYRVRTRSTRNRRMQEKDVEAATGVEPAMEVLQTSGGRTEA